MKKIKLFLPLMALIAGFAIASPVLKADTKASADAPAASIVYADNLDGFLTMYSEEKVVSDPSVIKVNKDTSFTAIKMVYSFKVTSSESFDSSVTCVLNTNKIEEKNIRILKIKDNTYSALNFTYKDNQATFSINEAGLFGLVDLTDSKGTAQDPVWLPVLAISLATVGIATAVVALVMGVKKHEK